MRRLTLVLAAAATCFAVAAPAASADPTIAYFTLPANYTDGGGLDTTPAGIVYFGAGINSQDTSISQRPPIGRLDPALAVAGTSNGMTFAPTPTNLNCCATQIRDIAWSAKTGTLFWTRSDGAVGRADGTVMQSVSTSGQVGPWGIAADPAGGAWLTEYNTGNTPNYYGARAAHLSSAMALDESLPNLAKQTGTLDDIRYDPQPKGIAVGSDGATWFAESSAGNPGWRIGKVATPYTEYSLPCVSAAPCSGSYTGTGPSDVAVAADGSVWYTNELNRTIGHLIPGGPISEYPIVGLPGGVPKAIRAASDGSLWVAVYGGYSNSTGNGIEKLIPGVAAASPQVASVQTPNFQPLEVAPDAGGNVWFSGVPTSAGITGAIGRLGGSPTVTPTPTPTPTPGATPTAEPTAVPTASPLPAVTTPILSTPVTVAPVVTVANAQVTDPTVHGDSMSANQICVGPPQDRCSLVYLIQTHEYVTGLPGSRSAFAAGAKSKLVTIGKATVSLSGGQKKKITIKLNAQGRKLLKKAKKLKSTLTVTQAVNGGKPKTVLKKSVTFKR